MDSTFINFFGKKIPLKDLPLFGRINGEKSQGLELKIVTCTFVSIGKPPFPEPVLVSF